MSALTFYRYIIECDGCHARHGEPNGHRGSSEARAAAYADGWRFPAMVLKNGKPGSSTSDVCPTCIHDWTPLSWGLRRGSGRVLKKDESPATGNGAPAVVPQEWPETKFTTT